MAAHGSGAVALSRGHGVTVLNVDIGGGTTKFALIENGRDPRHLRDRGRRPADGRRRKDGLTRIEPPAKEVARASASSSRSASRWRRRTAERIAERMARIVMGMIDLRQPGELARRCW